MTSLKDFTFESLEAMLISIGEKKYRAKQIYQWIYSDISDIDEMTDISKELRAKLKQDYYISKLEIRQKLQSAIDECTKYLLQLDDGNFIESMLMRYKHGLTICISTQVGCKMGCSFCASTRAGFVRNLTPSEMIDQVIAVEEDYGERISNIVLMGIGEPLDNFENTKVFLSNAVHPWGLAIGQRHITLSTCGLADKIRELSHLDLQVSMAVSLHAARDDIRDKLMPINKRYNIAELMKSCKYYSQNKNRRISFEYALIEGVNDSENDAMKLVDLLRGYICYINLIPLNTIKEADYAKPKWERCEKFRDILMKNGIDVTVRREMGSDINGACGQLRAACSE